MKDPLNPVDIQKPLPPGRFVARVRDGQLELVRELAEDDFLEYEAAAQVLADFSYRNRLFKMVALNLNALAEAIDDVASKTEHAEQLTAQAVEDIHVETGRWMHNLLSSFSAYLGLTEKNLSRAHGKESAFYTEFKTMQSVQYDAFFSYRFVCKLRNYSQHRDMPIGKFEVARQSLGIPFSSISETSVLFSRDDLLAHSDVWGERVRAELQAQEEFFDVYPHVATAVECLFRIHQVSLADIGGPLTRSVGTVIATLAGAMDEGMEPYIVESSNVDPASGAYRMSLKQTPRHLLADAKMVLNRGPKFKTPDGRNRVGADDQRDEVTQRGSDGLLVGRAGKKLEQRQQAANRRTAKWVSG